MSPRSWNLLTAVYLMLLIADVEVDAFLIALSCVGLIFMLPMCVLAYPCVLCYVTEMGHSLFIDAMRKESVVRHVWFECFWIGIFCLMQLGA